MLSVIEHSVKNKAEIPHLLWADKAGAIGIVFVMTSEAVECPDGVLSVFFFSFFLFFLIFIKTWEGDMSWKIRGSPG